MNPRQLNLLLWLVAAALAATCVAIVYLGVTAPLNLSTPNHVNVISRSDAPETTKEDSLPTLDELQVVSGLVLRQTLIEVKPVEAPKPVIPAPPAPKLDLQLTGTVIESDRPYAILSDARGSARLVRVGDEVKDAVVQTITAESVTLLVNNQQVTLEVITPEQGGRRRRR